MTSVSAWGRCRLNKKRADLKTFIMTQWGEHPIAAPKSERWWWWWIFWWPSARVRCLQLLPACFFSLPSSYAFFPVVSAARHRVCTQGIGRRDCQMGAAVDNIRRRQFLLLKFSFFGRVLLISLLIKYMDLSQSLTYWGYNVVGWYVIWSHLCWRILQQFLYRTFFPLCHLSSLLFVN